MSEQTATRRTSGASGGILERMAWRMALAGASRIRIGALTVVLPDGSVEVFGDATSELLAEIHIHDRQAWSGCCTRRDRGGEAYMDGFWSSLTPDLRFVIANRSSLALSNGWWRVPAQLRRTMAHRARRNSKGQSRKNISAHYDLGNDFYRLFLDETMTYSSAVFATPDESLADAQRNKYRLMAEGAGLSAGMHVLEIGCGWGGFALYAAGELGCRVTSITISQEQHDLTERVRAGLSTGRHPAA
jgi:cyclopropane-fatty-acyl-phospholipid synthase